MGDLVECVKIRFQLYMDMPDFHKYEVERVHSLCSAFFFWYESKTGNENLLFVDFYYPVNNYFLSSEFNTIIKTFAVMHGYQYLGVEQVKIPYTEAICLSSADKDC